MALLLSLTCGAALPTGTEHSPYVTGVGHYPWKRMRTILYHGKREAAPSFPPHETKQIVNCQNPFYLYPEPKQDNIFFHINIRNYCSGSPVHKNNEEIIIFIVLFFHLALPCTHARGLVQWPGFL